MKNYIIQIHSLFGGTFGYKGGIPTQLIFYELENPAKSVDILKFVTILETRNSMHRL